MFGRSMFRRPLYHIAFTALNIPGLIPRPPYHVFHVNFLKVSRFRSHKSLYWISDIIWLTFFFNLWTKLFKSINLIKRQFIYSTDSELPLVAVLQPLLTTKNSIILQYEPSEIVTEYSPRMRNFILGLELGFSNSNILLVIALALLLVVTISLVTIRCRKWRKAHSKGNTSQVRVEFIEDGRTGFGDNDLSPTQFVSNIDLLTNFDCWKLFVGKSSWGTYFIESMFEKISRLKLRLKTFSADFEIIFRNQKNEISTWFLVF